MKTNKTIAQAFYPSPADTLSLPQQRLFVFLHPAPTPTRGGKAGAAETASVIDAGSFPLESIMLELQCLPGQSVRARTPGPPSRRWIWSEHEKPAFVNPPWPDAGGK